MNWNCFKSLQVQNNNQHLRTSVSQSEWSIQQWSDIDRLTDHYSLLIYLLHYRLQHLKLMSL